MHFEFINKLATQNVYYLCKVVINTIYIKTEGPNKYLCKTVKNIK